MFLANVEKQLTERAIHLLNPLAIFIEKVRALKLLLPRDGRLMGVHFNSLHLSVNIILKVRQKRFFFVWDSI